MPPYLLRHAGACASFASLLVFVCGLAADAKEPTPETEAKLPRFEKEILAFEKWDHQNAVPQNGVLFVGSSTVRLWQTATDFPGLPVINRGFGGSTIADANRFAERIVIKYKPAVIVFYSGDNDIASGKSPQKVFENFLMFFKLVREKLPETRIVVLSVKPSVARWKKWPQAQEVNALLQGLAKEEDHLTYIDISPPMLGPDGQPRPDIFREDGLHMNAKGYELWNGILTPVLQKLTGK